MKLKELYYFFDSYNIPMLRRLYPTNEQLWESFNKQEGTETRAAILLEIEWVLEQSDDIKKDVMRYLNQVGIMGAIRLKKTQEMTDFLVQMKIHITV